MIDRTFTSMLWQSDGFSRVSMTPASRLSARASGGLSVEAYGKFVQVQRIDREGLASIRETVAALAETEGLLAHRDPVEIRFEDPAR